MRSVSPHADSCLPSPSRMLRNYGRPGTGRRPEDRGKPLVAAEEGDPPPKITAPPVPARMLPADLGNENTGNPVDGTEQEPKARRQSPHRCKRPPEQGAAAPAALRSTRVSGLGLHAPLTGLQGAPNPSPYSRLTTTPRGKPKRQSSPVYEELRSRHGLQGAQARAACAPTASWRAPLLRISALIRVLCLVLTANPLWRLGQTPAQGS
ncbi:unnamed protein product [Rangifer tarandus platyrhynchus]|uniref:Uncharacterized protein n=1 Tax=Rangifer tarandus platyrhynchus TaxID=3082113 RepID=A0AC59Z3U2_RANTA